MLRELKIIFFLICFLILICANQAFATITTVEITAAGDNFIKDTHQDENEGSNTHVRIQNANISRVIVSFNTDDIENAIGEKQVLSAKLKLFIETNFGNWGSGSYIDVHRIDADWLEMSSTWSCQNDTNLGNTNPDCSPLWSGGTFNSTAVASVFHTNSSTGYQVFDVTSDFLPIVDGRDNFGWLVKKRTETASGSVDYTSVQGTAAQRPKLVLELVDSALVDVVPGTYYNQSVTTTLYSGFANLGYSMTLNGSAWTSGNTVSANGDYTFEVFKSSDSSIRLNPVVFTIDTTAPTIQFRTNPGGGVPLITVVDENENPALNIEKVDGVIYNRSTSLTAGTHTLSVTTTDLAGNQATSSTSFNMPVACTPQTYIDYVTPRRNLSAVHYYPWHNNNSDIPAQYKPCPNGATLNRSWCYCINASKGIQPFLGFYSNADSTVVNKHINAINNKKIDVVSIEWTGLQISNVNLAIQKIDDHTDNGVCHANPEPALGTPGCQHFILVYDLAVIFGAQSINFDISANRTRFINDFTTFASSSTYFKHADYLKFKNRPVVYIYVSRAIQGTTQNIETAINGAFNAATSNGFAGLYIVADHLWWNMDTDDYALLDTINAMSATMFAPITTDQGVPENASQRPVKTWADKMKSTYLGSLTSLDDILSGVDVQPGVFSQFSSYGFETAQCLNTPNPDVHKWNLKDATDFDYMLKKGGVQSRRIAEKHQVLQNCTETITSNSDWTSVIFDYSYNEWGEGSGIERLSPKTPRFPYGFGQDLINLQRDRLQ